MRGRAFVSIVFSTFRDQILLNNAVKPGGVQDSLEKRLQEATSAKAKLGKALILLRKKAAR